MTGRLIAVVGPSGVGKDTVMAALVRRDPRLVLARRIITRPSSAGGEDYEGVTTAEFEIRKARGDFALSWPAHGLHYAIPISVTAQMAKGHDVVANLSRAALVQAQDHFARFEVINLTAENTVLATRLALRGRESAAQIESRLARASTPLPTGIVAHHVDNGGRLKQTVQTVYDCLYPVRP